MTHYGCETWACVEAIFAEGGSLAGLQGWLYILMAANNGDRVEMYSTSDGANYVYGNFQLLEGTISVTGVNAFVSNRQGSFGYDAPISGDHFARLGLLNGNTQTAGDFYALHGANPVNAGLNEQRVDCRHQDCVALGLSTTSSALTGITAACLMTGFVPCTGIAGFAGTLVGGAEATWAGYQYSQGHRTFIGASLDIGTFALGLRYGERLGGAAGVVIDLASNLIPE